MHSSSQTSQPVDSKKESSRKGGLKKRQRREDGPGWTRSDVACLSCRRSKVRCSDERPCHRCVKLGKECIDSEHASQAESQTSTDSTAVAAPTIIPAFQTYQQQPALLDTNVLVTSPSLSPEDLFIENGVAYSSSEGQPSVADATLDELLCSLLGYYPNQPQHTPSQEDGKMQQEQKISADKDFFIWKLKVELGQARRKIDKLQREMLRIEEASKEFCTIGYNEDTAVFIVGHFGRIIACNEPMRRRLGIQVEDYTDRHLMAINLMDPPFVTHLFQQLRRFILGEIDRVNFAVLLRRPHDGKPLKALLEGFPTMDRMQNFILLARVVLHFVDE